MKSIIQQIADRKEDPERQFVTCMKRRGWPRVAVEVCKKCKLSGCKNVATET